jgi:hypothetical protein
MSGDATFEVPIDAADADLGILLAQRRAEVGFSPFTPAAVLEQQLKLRVAVHMLELGALFYAAHEPPPPEHEIKICLAVGSERESYFVSIQSWTPESGSTATARLYGDVLNELVLPYEHFDLVAKCTTGCVDPFNTWLSQLLRENSELK